MDQRTFEAALEPAPRPVCLRTLAQRFNYALHRTGDLRSAMAAVNEHLEAALTYRELLALFRR